MGDAMIAVSGVYVRAKTSDGRWATVDATHLTEESFRRLILDTLVREGALTGLMQGEESEPLKTDLTKDEAERT